MTPQSQFPEPLSRDAFDLWREGHDAKMDQILGVLEGQTAHNLTLETRLTTLETEHRIGLSTVAARASFWSTIIAAVIGATSGFVAAVFGGHTH